MLLSKAGNQIQKIHRIGYDEPENCMTPCAMEMPWSMLEVPLIVFASKDVFEKGAGETYEFYKKYLQLLAWSSSDISSNKIKNGIREDDGLRWMLKCTLHLPYL